MDYAPGATAHVAGSGFQVGEPGELQVSHTDQALNTGSGHARALRQLFSHSL